MSTAIVVLVFLYMTTTPAIANTISSDSHSEIKNISELRKEELWQRYIRDFRSQHNLSLTGVFKRTNWKIRDAVASNTTEYEYENDVVGMRFHYTYHIQMVRNLGFYLGTGFGLGLEIVEDSEVFDPQYYYSLPSLKIGFVYNYSSKHRLIIGYEQYLKRYDQFIVRIPDSFFTSQENPPNIGITLNTFDFEMSFDYFLNIKWGIRLTARYSLGLYFNQDLNLGSLSLIHISEPTRPY